ncbi:alpha/beta hydrolase family protein [Pedobacter sp. GR22-10]|uniref:alpha/beta hydrolase family protein n=1 Tax=Pedobacter sp. GR22-10 TaxID=2994472 RepID=UPI0022469BDD|nr:alpha/beta fold hydrolase [Pedobacter sp. GR22-10]MCX2430395.1 alpha/beta fold hydrolase [Pedobacter sp. GR22-10]
MKEQIFDTQMTNALILAAPGREHPLEVRLTAPVTGTELPLILFAHGFGSSAYGYDPLVNYWAARGFLVIQPTFLDSKTLLGIPDASHQDAINAYLANPASSFIWRQRLTDMKLVLDQLDTIEKAMTGIEGHFDRNQVFAAGHSFGAHTVGLLLGSRVNGLDGALGENLRDERIRAGVLLSAGGRGGDVLSEFAKKHFTYLDQNYDELLTPTFVIAGDNDHSPLTVLGPEWFTEAYYLSPGADALLTLTDGEHMLGGITGYGAQETTDENPERVRLVQKMSYAYFRSKLYPEDTFWRDAIKALSEDSDKLGKIEEK